jgi:hypothetical protein
MIIAYKLFRVMKDGTISSLFINKKERYPLNVWLDFKDIPTKGFKQRPGWHSMAFPHAPHLSEKGRKWFKVEIENIVVEQRPESQGGRWFLSKRLKIIEKINI